MEILKPGNPVMRMPSPSFPIGYEIVCLGCNCMFKLGIGDEGFIKGGVYAEKRPNGLQRATVECPNCHNDCIIQIGNPYPGIGIGPLDQST